MKKDTVKVKNNEYSSNHPKFAHLLSFSLLFLLSLPVKSYESVFCSDEKTTLLERQAFSISINDRIEAVTHLCTPKEIVESIAQDNKEVFLVRYAITQSTSATKTALNSLMEADEWMLRTMAAAHPVWMKNELEKMAYKKGYAVSAGVAYNKNTPAYVLELLTQHPNFLVRIYAVKNSALPDSLLGRLSQDQHHHVRLEVAKSKRASRDNLLRLAKDDSTSVRAAVAANPNTPHDMLRKLTCDHDKEVRQTAKDSLLDRGQKDPFEC
jgi:hypothetical protein